MPVQETGACGGDGVARGDFILSTQADIAALAGCREVDGGVFVKEFPGIDTSALGSLRRVTGSLGIVGAEQGDHEPHLLDGFRQIESLGGLSLSRLRLADLSAFARLRTIESAPAGKAQADGPSGVLGISECTGLQNLAGLEALEHLDALSLVNLPDLTSVTGLDSLRELESLSLFQCALQDLGGLAHVELGALSARATQLHDLSGLNLRGDALTSVLSLEDNPSLVSLGGWQPAELSELVVRGNGSLVDLRGLEGLTSVHDATIESEASLTSLDGLEGLISAGSLTVSSNRRLRSIAGLASLRAAEYLWLTDNESLDDLAGLSPEVAIDRLGLLDLPSLTELSGLGSPSLVGLSIEGAAIVDLRGLERATVREDIHLAALPALTSLAGMPSVPDWSSLNLSIFQCPALRDLGELASQSEIRTLWLEGTGLTDADALANLRAVIILTLINNPQLTQIDGLGSLQQLGSLQIEHNPALRVLPELSQVDASCDNCFSSAILVGNAALERIGPWPVSTTQVRVDDHPALVSITLPALRFADALRVTGNASLTTLAVPSLEASNNVTVLGNPVLDDTTLASVAQGPAFTRVKITGNLTGPARRAPCPWVDDAVCDEVSEDCAPGTDTLDCSADG
jgi:Leucine-rich repeat (LRR) protein